MHLRLANGTLAYVAVVIAVAVAVLSTVAARGRALAHGAANGNVQAKAGISGQLVFVRAGAHGTGLFVISADGSGLRRRSSGLDEEPAWSPDGARIVFSRSTDRGRSYELHVVAAGQQGHAITHGGGFAQSPSWSPDGARIVFSASGGRFGRSSDPSCFPNLWVVRPNGSGLRRLLGRGIQPAYSPKGDRVAFVRPARDERPWIYIVGANGKGLRRLGVGSHPSWSPDGRRVVVERPEGRNRMSDLWSLRVGDGRAHRLTRTGSLAELGPVWSPDGRWIAFSMVRGGRQEIYALPASGGDPHEITRGPRDTGSYDPAWRPLPAAKRSSGSSPGPLTLPLPGGHRSTEASIAVDPTQPSDVLVLARDEDYGRFVGLRLWRSHDGGHSFRGGMLVPRRLDGRPADGSDPVALFDHRGRPAPAFLALRYGQSTWQTRIMLGGRTVISAKYGPPFPTLADIDGRTWYDKPWAAIDPRSGRAYVTWTERGSTATGPTEKVALASASTRGPFSKPHLLGIGSGSQPVIGRGPNVVVVWFEQPNLSQWARIMSSRSADHGRTWSASQVVARGINSRGNQPFPTVVRAGSGFVACWQEYTLWPRERIACSHTRVGGSWSPPRIVAQPPGAGDAAQPALAASPHGGLWLAFYRFTGRSTSVELWSSGANDKWRRRAVLMRSTVPRSGSSFLGDYQGLVATDGSVMAAFTMPVRPGAFRQVVRVARFSTHR